MATDLTKSEQFRDFLVYVAREGYASDTAQISQMSDGSHDLVIEQDGWRFHDNWFGGEPFGGREVIARDGKVFWMMTYYGSFLREQVEGTKALREAMRQPDNTLPVRGPKHYTTQNNLVYQFKWSGDLASFRARETIHDSKGSIVYEAEVSGGVVDL